jgi:hypothetical protein
MKILFVLLILLFSYTTANSQSDFSKNSLKFSVGLGFIDSYKSNIDGPGTSYTIGYQRNLWKERLRMNPSLGIGFFTNKYTTDIPAAYCNSINLQNNLYIDLVKIRSFSLVAGGGLFLNNLRGIRGRRYTGGSSIEYFSEYTFGGYGGAGIRINPKKKRFAFDLMPINMNFGVKDFTEFAIRIAVDYKLK